MIKRNTCLNQFTHLLTKQPDALAQLCGGEEYKSIYGTVKFYQTGCGCLVASEVAGLPACENECCFSVLGFHIHAGKSCTGNAKDPFADTLSHFDKYVCKHPYHAGDMPPLFSNNGYALSIFLTNRFNVSEIIGRAVVIHSMPDDFNTQPSGGAGEKIACGIITLCN